MLFWASALYADKKKDPLVRRESPKHGHVDPYKRTGEPSPVPFLGKLGMAWLLAA